MNRETEQHLLPLSRFFVKTLETAQRWLDHHDTETNNTLAGVDVPEAAAAMAQLVESVLHSVESRVQLLGRLVQLYEQRIVDLEEQRRAQTVRLDAAQEQCETLHRGSLTRILGLTVGAYLGTLALAVVLGLILVETLIAWIQLPIAMNIARLVARTAEFLAEKMGLAGADASTFIQRITSQANSWHPEHLYATCTVMGLGLTVGLMLYQTHAQIMVGASNTIKSKTPFVIADLCFSAGLYFLRAPDLSKLNMTALAIALFDCSVLLTTLFASARIGQALHTERELRREYSRVTNGKDSAERHLASTDASLSIAMQSAQEFALQHDQLNAQTTMRAESIANVVKADIRRESNVAKAEDEVKRDGQVIQLFKREAKRVTA